jgi:hypothetical protein
LAAGAILPPLFFERRRLESTCSENGILRNTRKPNRVGRRIHSPNSVAGINQPGHPCGSLLKDI